MALVRVMQHVEPETAGAIAAALERGGHATHVVRPFRGDPVPCSLDTADALVVMGGPMGVYESDRFPHLLDEIALIEDALRREVPILGICLGSQLLAAALGAPVAPGPAKEIGWFPVTLSATAGEDALFAGIDSPIDALHWHGDRFELPAGAVALASSARTPVQGFRFAERAYGLLFHLEVTRTIVAGMVAAFDDELREERLDGSIILRETDARLVGLETVRRTVFDRFAALIPPG